MFYLLTYLLIATPSKCIPPQIHAITYSVIHFTSIMCYAWYAVYGH